MIPKRGRAVIPTDIAVQMPFGTYGMISGRSGLAFKHSIVVFPGTIDYDYTGEIKLLVFNFSDNDYEVKYGDRVAQLICQKICYPSVEETNCIFETARNAKGFGSTGY